MFLFVKQSLWNLPKRQSSRNIVFHCVEISEDHPNENKQKLLIQSLIQQGISHCHLNLAVSNAGIREASFLMLKKKKVGGASGVPSLELILNIKAVIKKKKCSEITQL